MWFFSAVDPVSDLNIISCDRIWDIDRQKYDVNISWSGNFTEAALIAIDVFRIPVSVFISGIFIERLSNQVLVAGQVSSHGYIPKLSLKYCAHCIFITTHAVYNTSWQYMQSSVNFYKMNCTPGESGLEQMFFPGCMSSVQYFVS